MEKQKVVGIKFEEKCCGKIYYFDPQDLTLKVGDKVIVETTHGISMGFVAFVDKEVDTEELVEPLKKIIRIANEKDLLTVQKLKEKERFAVTEAKKFSAQLKLDMQIVNAEYAFDESKVTINFTADDRVDFRDLVKILAGALKTRIELRQVGARDKAKILGGIGLCGREVCCKRFLPDFEKVNIKMAKNQGISLNPNNINGVCGRLLCCLSYENEQYVELIKLMPKLNSKVSTKDGVGIVVYNDLLKKLVSVKFIDDKDNFHIEDYPLEEISLVETEQTLPTEEKPSENKPDTQS